MCTDVRQSTLNVTVRRGRHVHDLPPTKGSLMSKRARKRRSRKGNKANHGRKPNA